MFNNTIEEFTQRVVSELKEYLPNKEKTNYSLEVLDVPKTNGVTLKGIAIKEGNNIISPTIYMDDYFT